MEIIFVLAVVVVALTSLFKFEWLAPKAKAAIAALVAVVASAVYVWQTGDVSEDLWQTILIVYGLAQGLYTFLLDGSSLDDKLESLGDWKTQ